MAKDFEALSLDYENIEVSPGSDVSAGDFVSSGDTKGFFIVDVKAGEKGVVVTKCDSVKVVKNTGESWTPGITIYWDGGGGVATISSSGTVLIGVAKRSALTADTEGFISFDGRSAFLKL